MDIALGREETFQRLYAEHFDRLLGYALRRVDRPEEAADVVADTFLVAWRRLPDVPPGHEGRLWLYGVARRTLANQRRADGRRSRLGERLRSEVSTVVSDHADLASVSADVTAALASLSSRDREVLELSAWEELAPREIAEVLGVSALAVRTRLSRARARMRELVRNDPDPAGHLPGNHPIPARKEGP